MRERILQRAVQLMASALLKHDPELIQSLASKATVADWFIMQAKSQIEEELSSQG